jgi:hypothetical protein
VKSIKLYLGLDVHKDSITIAQPSPQGVIRLFGSIANEADRLEKVLAHIHSHQSTNPEGWQRACPP